MSFSCPHFDLPNDYCLRLKTDCVPGRPGCVIGSEAVFATPVEERIRAKEAEKRAALLARLSAPPSTATNVAAHRLTRTRID